VRWVAAAVAGLLVFTGAGVGILSSLFASGDPALANRIVAVVNEVIGTDSTRLDCERVHGTLLRGAVLERPRLLVRTPEGEMTWASARRIHIEYDLLAYLFTARRAFRATVDSPIVRLVHDARGGIVSPRFASRPPRGVRGPETRVYLAARGGTLSLDRGGVGFSAIHGTALFTSARGRSALLLEELSALPDSAARAGGAVRVEGLLTIAEGTVRVDPLEIAYGSSRLLARADWSLSGGRVEEGSVTLGPLRIADVLRFADLEGADGTLRGEMTFAGLLARGEANACLEGEIAGESVDTLLVTAAFTPDAVNLTKLRLRVRGAEVTGSGAIPARGPIEASLRFRGVDPAFLPWWKPPEGTPRGSLAGTVRLVARRTKPKPSLTAAFALETSRVGRVSVSGGRFAVRTESDGAAVIDSGSVDVAGGRLFGRGQISADGTLQAALSGVVQDLGAMDSLLKPVAADAGRGRVFVELSGPIASPSFAARGDLWGLRLSSGAACDTLGVAARGQLGAAPHAQAELSGRGLNLNGRPLGQAEASVTLGERIVIDRYVQTLGDTTLTWRGSVAFRERGADAIVDSLRFQAGELRVRNLEPVRLSLEGGRLKAAPLSLDLSPGRLDVDFDWDVKRGRIDARGALQGFDVTRVPAAGAAGEPVRGEVRGQFLASGPVKDPDLSVFVDVLRPAYGGVLGDTLSLDLEYVPGVLTVERALWVGGAGRVTVTGAARAPFPLEEWLRRIGRKDDAWGSRVTLALEGVVDSLDLALLAPADTALRTLEGVASVRLRVSGTASDPVVSLRGDCPRLAFQGVEGRVTALALDYANRRLAIERFDFIQGEAVSTIVGEVPVDLSLFAKERLLRDGTLRLTVRIPDADFKIASIVSPYIASSGGRLSVTADVTGTPRAPRISGALRLTNGTLRLAGREEILEGLTLEGTFDEERLTIARASARQGRRGRLTGSGSWRWGGLPSGTAGRVVAGPPGEYQFTLKAADFTTTDRETYLFRLTGTFQIQNVQTPSGQVMPRITGSAVLSKGDLTLKLAEPSEEPPPGVPFLYDVTVDVPGGLFYRTVDSDVELTGTLRLKDEGQGDLALGVMSVKNGRYYLFTREIGNLKGDFTFNSLDRIDPEIAVDGETKVQEGDGVINVSLTGRASRPVLHLWDSKGTSQADLWKALTFGQFSSTGTDDPGPNAQGGAPSGPDLALPIRDYLFRNAERWIAASGFIDTIDLRSGARSGGETGSGGGPIDLGRVGVGKYVTQDLYLNYSNDFSGQAEWQTSAEYRVTRFLLLRGQRIQRRAEGTVPQEYNLDLKIRLEY
jgi:hypothetical protein